MRFLFASDSFKGTLTSEEIISILAETAKEVFPECQCAGVPVADGGEGTVDAVVKAMHGSLRTVTVHGPLMEPAEASYGVFGGQAVIEMAAASGLPMVPAGIVGACPFCHRLSGESQCLQSGEPGGNHRCGQFCHGCGTDRNPPWLQ